MREDAFLQAHHPHAVELQPLGGVERHQSHLVGLRLVVLEAVFLLLDLEHEVVEEAADDRGQIPLPRAGPFVLVECPGHLLHAGPPGLGLGRIILVFLLQKPLVAGGVEEPEEHGSPAGLARRGGRPRLSEGHQPGDRINAGPRRRRELPRVAAAKQLPPEAVPRRGRGGAGRLHRGGGEATRRHVGDPRQGQVVVGLHEHPQERHHVFDLAAVEERPAAHELIGDVSSSQFLLEGPGLLTGADEDHGFGGDDEPLPQQALDVGDHSAGFVDLVLRLDDRRRHAWSSRGDQRLAVPASVPLDQHVGRPDDLGRGAVVFLEPHDPRAGPAAGEVEDVRHLGPAPGVDRLVVVTHHADAAMVAGERRENPLLDTARILVFVDQQVVEAAGLNAADVLMLGEELIHEQQQVVEVDCAGGLQGVLVAAVAGRGERPAVVGVGRDGVHRHVGTDGPALPTAHAIEQVGRPEHGVGDLQFLEHAAGRGLLLAAVDDREPFGVAETGGVPPQDADTQRVDRGNLGLLVEPFLQSLSRPGEHLAGSFVGEGHRENPRGLGAPPHQVADPRNDHAGLARAGAGEHEEGPRRRGDGLGLSRVESG